MGVVYDKLPSPQETAMIQGSKVIGFNKRKTLPSGAEQSPSKRINNGPMPGFHEQASSSSAQADPTAQAALGVTTDESCSSAQVHPDLRGGMSSSTQVRHNVVSNESCSSTNVHPDVPNESSSSTQIQPSVVSNESCSSTQVHPDVPNESSSSTQVLDENASVLTNSWRPGLLDADKPVSANGWRPSRAYNHASALLHASAMASAVQAREKHKTMDEEKPTPRVSQKSRGQKKDNTSIDIRGGFEPTMKKNLTPSMAKKPRAAKAPEEAPVVTNRLRTRAMTTAQAKASTEQVSAAVPKLKKPPLTSMRISVNAEDAEKHLAEQGINVIDWATVALSKKHSSSVTAQGIVLASGKSSSKVQTQQPAAPTARDTRGKFLKKNTKVPAVSTAKANAESSSKVQTQRPAAPTALTSGESSSNFQVQQPAAPPTRDNRGMFSKKKNEKPAEPAAKASRGKTIIKKISTLGSPGSNASHEESPMEQAQEPAIPFSKASRREITANKKIQQSTDLHEKFIQAGKSSPIESSPSSSASSSEASYSGKIRAPAQGNREGSFNEWVLQPTTFPVPATQLRGQEDMRAAQQDSASSTNSPEGTKKRKKLPDGDEQSRAKRSKKVTAQTDSDAITNEPSSSVQSSADASPGYLGRVPSLDEAMPAAQLHDQEDAQTATPGPASSTNGPDRSKKRKNAPNGAEKSRAKRVKKGTTQADDPLPHEPSQSAGQGPSSGEPAPFNRVAALRAKPKSAHKKKPRSPAKIKAQTEALAKALARPPVKTPTKAPAMAPAPAPRGRGYNLRSGLKDAKEGQDGGVKIEEE